MLVVTSNSRMARQVKEERNESKLVVLEDEARRAIAGNRAALERLVRALQGDIYGLALRMLCNREDAEDATQEILVRIVTHLSQFDFRSKLKTWAYRVAVSYGSVAESMGTIRGGTPVPRAGAGGGGG